MIDFAQTPNDRRAFVHKKLLGAAVGFITGGPTAAAAGFLRGGRGSSSSVVLDRGVGLGGGGASRRFELTPAEFARSTPTGKAKFLGLTGAARVDFLAQPSSVQATQFGGFFGGGGGGDCRFPKRLDPRTGECRIFLGSQSGPDSDVLPSGAADGFGEAVMGAFGMPALVPRVVGQIEKADGTVGNILRCPRGAVLAIDDLCYDSPGKFRKWKRGTRPFLTGGDVKCLRRANTLRRSKSSKKLMRELGMGG